MRAYLLIALCGVLAFTGCQKKVFTPLVEGPPLERHVYKHNMRIDTASNIHGLYYLVSENGNDDVFLYRLSWGEADEVFDNEYWSSVWFPVEPGQTSFSYTNEELGERRCYYLGSGAWGGYGYEKLQNGIISGTMNADSTWDITIDVTLQKPENHFTSSRILAKRTFSKGNY